MLYNTMNTTTAQHTTQITETRWTQEHNVIHLTTCFVGTFYILNYPDSHCCGPKFCQTGHALPKGWAQGPGRNKCEISDRLLRQSFLGQLKVSKAGSSCQGWQAGARWGGCLRHYYQSWGRASALSLPNVTKVDLLNKFSCSFWDSGSNNALALPLLW